MRYGRLHYQGLYSSTGYAYLSLYFIYLQIRVFTVNEVPLNLFFTSIIANEPKLN